MDADIGLEEHFSQENLYGDNAIEITNSLRLPSYNLTGEIATNFITAISNHVRFTMQSKKTQIPSFGKGKSLVLILQ